MGGAEGYWHGKEEDYYYVPHMFTYSILHEIKYCNLIYFYKKLNVLWKLIFNHPFNWCVFVAIHLFIDCVKTFLYYLYYHLNSTCNRTRSVLSNPLKYINSVQEGHLFQCNAYLVKKSKRNVSYRLYLKLGTYVMTCACS